MGHGIDGAVTPAVGVVEAPGVRVEVRAVTPRLDVTVDLGTGPDRDPGSSSDAVGPRR
jgi:hypothetical protein